MLEHAPHHLPNHFEILDQEKAGNYCRPSISHVFWKHFGLGSMFRRTILALYDVALAVCVINMVNESVGQVSLL